MARVGGRRVAAGRGGATSGQVSAAMDRLRARASDLERVASGTLVADLDRVARGWLDPADPLRREALDRVSAEAALSREGVAWGLDAAFETLTADGIDALLAREIGDPALLDTPRVAARGVSVHVQAGNVFTAALPRLFASLLARCPALLKAPGDAPAFTELLVRSFRERGGNLERAVEGLAWRGGHLSPERPLWPRAAVVLVYGTDATVDAVRSRLRGDATFLGFGHRTSVEVVDRENATADADLLRRIALDVCAYDQRGCLSPQVVYVERGGELSPREFAAALARDGFPEVSARLPPGPGDEASEAARFEHLGVARFLGEVWEGEGFAVCYRPEAAFELGCGGRVVDVRPVDDVLDLAPPLAPIAGRLQGVAAAVDGSDLPRLVRVAASLGASRVCRPGRLQRPPAAWRNDGVPVLLPFLRFVDVE